MPCPISYVPIQVRSPEDILNERRDVALKKIEEELANGIARIEVDPITGGVKIVGASEWPEGMADLCVLDALQTRNSIEWQLAAAQAGVQDKNFVAAHAHAHAHGHKH
jgi:hypothetical protein